MKSIDNILQLILVLFSFRFIDKCCENKIYNSLKFNYSIHNKC